MTDVPNLTEAEIAKALADVKKTSLVVPDLLMVTNEGIDRMAQRLTDGEISAERMREVGIGDDLIAEVEKRSMMYRRSPA